MKIVFIFSILTVLFSGCSTSREQVVQKMAHEIGHAETKLKNRTVAILNPEARGSADEAEARELAEILTHEIVSSSQLRVAERNRLGDVLKEQELVQSGVSDPATAARLGRLLMVDAVLIGSITGKPGKTEVYLRLVDSETALILQTARGVLPASSPMPDAAREKAKSTEPPGNSPATAAAHGKATAAKDRRNTASFAGNTGGSLEVAEEPQGKLIDISYRKAGAGGYHQVIGRVENTGRVVLQNSRVSLQFYNAGKQLIGGGACMSPDQPLLAGQKLPFSCLFKPPEDFSRFEATLDTSGTIFASKALNLSATGLRFRKDAGSITGDYQLSGTLRNDEDTVVTYPRILLSVFDAKGKFIGSGYGFAVKKELAPGESTPFTVSVHAYALQGKAARYEAFYSALPTRR